MDAHTRLAEWLGVTAHQAPSTAGAALVEEGPDAAAAVMAAQFPAEVDRVYLQHDLTIVSPGPLAPEIETRLRGIAELESRALASTFRISAASVDRALTAGETADGIRTFLSTHLPHRAAAAGGLPDRRRGGTARARARARGHGRGRALGGALGRPDAAAHHRGGPDARLAAAQRPAATGSW